MSKKNQVMKKQSFLILLLISCCLTLSGQQSVQLQGTVIDEGTGKPMPYANVVIKSKQIAAVTDDAGQFNLPVNEALLTDSIVISYLGYSRFSADIASYVKRRNKTIKLAPNGIQLKEVVISAKKSELMDIIKKTVQVYEKNKPKKTHIAKSYYREKAKYDNRYVMYAESIGYAIFKDFENKDKKYSFFCENTRKSDSNENWTQFSTIGKDDTKLSDVTSGCSATFYATRKEDNEGPISAESWKSYLYSFDSTYYEQNKKIYAISFKKGSSSGSIKIGAESYQILSITYFSKKIFSYLFHKEVTGNQFIEYIYLDKVPFINQIRFHYQADHLEYWNEYHLLAQKTDHFKFTYDDYVSMIWNEEMPFVEYNPESWELHKIPVDPDYSTICNQLKSASKTLEEQFVAHSGKRWMVDFLKILPTNKATYFNRETQDLRDIISNLKYLF